MKINVSVIVVNHGKVLLMQRALNDDYCPGAWGIPGGYMEEFEVYLEETAKRETKEELGLDVIPTGVVFNNRNNDTDSMYLVMSAKLKDPKDFNKAKLSEEANDYMWASKDDIGKLEFTPYTKDRIEKVLNDLS